MLVYAVFGDPVEHSLSPAMQKVTFAAIGLSARYIVFRVRRERLKDAILGAGSILGYKTDGQGVLLDHYGAKEHKERALNIYRNSFGEDHPKPNSCG